MDQIACFHTSLLVVVLNQEKDFPNIYEKKSEFLVFFQVYTIGQVNYFNSYLERRGFVKNQADSTQVKVYENGSILKNYWTAAKKPSKLIKSCVM